jgi:hypothetical protein
MENKTPEQQEDKQALISSASEIIVIVNDDDYKKARSVHKRLKAAVDFIAGKYDVQKREANKKYTDYLAKEKEILGDLPKKKKEAKAEYDRLLKEEKNDVGALKTWRNTIDTKLKSWRKSEKDRKEREEAEIKKRAEAERRRIMDENASKILEAELVAEIEKRAGASEQGSKNKSIDVKEIIEENLYCELHKIDYPLRHGKCPECATLTPAPEENRPMTSTQRCPGRPEDNVIDHTIEDVNKSLQEEIQKKTEQREAAKGATETEEKKAGNIQEEKPVYIGNITDAYKVLECAKESQNNQFQVAAKGLKLFMDWMNEGIKKNKLTDAEKDQNKVPPGCKIVRKSGE